jgi:putative transcription factor
MTVCGSCARLGTPYQEPKPAPSAATLVARPAPLISLHSVPPRPADRRVPREVQELDLADNYPQIIQKARRKQKLTQEDLAMKVKERLSIIQKIELGKMAPDMRLARTLEHVLRIKLLVPGTEPPVPKISTSAPKGVTLADVAKIRKKEGTDASVLET